MVDTRERRGGGFSRNPPPPSFSMPGAWRFSAAGLIGRMQMSMYGLGTVLLIAASTGRYGMAGAVASAGALGSAFVAPQVARLADQRGQRTVLRPLVTAFAFATAGLITAVEGHPPDWVLFIPAVVSGGAMPSLGSMVRARWSVLLAGSPQLHTAFSFESVADEMVFVLGPVLVTLLATEVNPAAGGNPVAGRGRPGADRAGAGVLVPGRDVRLGRPEHGRVRPALRAQTAGRVRARHLRAGERDRRPLVRHPDLAGPDRAAVRAHAGADRLRGGHVLGPAQPAHAGAGDVPVRADHRPDPDRRLQPGPGAGPAGPQHRGDDLAEHRHRGRRGGRIIGGRVHH